MRIKIALLLFFTLFFFSSLTVIHAAPPTPPAGYEWKMVFDDEFNGSTLDTTKWEHAPQGERRVGWWLNEDAYLDGSGHLVIRTKSQPDVNGQHNQWKPSDYPSLEYSSGAVQTKNHFTHTFGYYEASIQFDGNERGHWPAFWIFDNAETNIGNGGLDGAEIDIIEYWKPSTGWYTHTIHYDGYGSNEQMLYYSKYNMAINTGYHTIGVNWQSDYYTFYFDNAQTWQTNFGGPSRVPEYIMITDEIDNFSSLEGKIYQETLPAYMYVDYVRAYDLVPSTGSSPTPTPAPIAGDFNNDGKVDGIDYVYVLIHLGSGTTLADLTTVIANIH